MNQETMKFGNELTEMLAKNNDLLDDLRRTTGLPSADFMHGGCIILTDAMLCWIAAHVPSMAVGITIFAKDISGGNEMVVHTGLRVGGLFVDASGVQVLDATLLAGIEKEWRLKDARIQGGFSLADCLAAGCPYDARLSDMLVRMLERQFGNPADYFPTSATSETPGAANVPALAAGHGKVR